MGIKRIIDTDFWLDNKVVDLFSPEDKLFFLYLITNPHTTQLGIYPINKRVIAFELGYALEAVGVLLDRFQNKYNVIRYSEKTAEVAIKNYLRHSIIKGGKPVEDLLRKEIAKVKDKSLLEYVYQGISKDVTLNATVKDVLNELHNDNDNENDVSSYDSYHDSYHESSHVSSKKRFTPPTIDEVKAYCSERNNEIDPEQFVNFYQSKGWKVGNQPMKDWKAAIVTWEKREQKEKKTTADWEKELEEWANGTD